MLKVISGKWKNTSFFYKKKIKPTSMIIKKILFDWIGSFIFNKNCLDLFSGLGTLGFEAASRNCFEVTFVEKDRNIFNYLLSFKNKLRTNNLYMYNMDALKYVKKYKFKKFDIIFIDPPYITFKYLYFFIKNCLFLLKKNSLIFIETFIDVFLLLDYFKFDLKIKKKSSLGKTNFCLLERC